MYAQCNVDQVRGMVSERNTYYELLKECVKVFNELPNQKYSGGDTYKLVSKIEKVLNDPNNKRCNDEI